MKFDEFKLSLGGFLVAGAGPAELSQDGQRQCPVELLGRRLRGQPAVERLEDQGVVVHQGLKVLLVALQKEVLRVIQDPRSSSHEVKT